MIQKKYEHETKKERGREKEREKGRVGKTGQYGNLLTTGKSK